MENKQSLLKGAMILSIGVMLSKIIGLIYRMPLTNILGDIGNGLYTKAYQVYVVVLTLTATAIPAGLSKLIAEREAMGNYKEADRIFKFVLKGCFMISVFLGIGVSACADWIAKVIFNEPTLGLPIRVLTPTILITSIVASLRGYFQGVGNMLPIAKSQVIEQMVHVLFTLILAYYLIQYSLIVSVTGAVIGTSIGAMIALLILIMQYRKTYNGRKHLLEAQKEVHIETRNEMLKRVVAIILPIVVSSSVFSVMTCIDLSMLSNILPESISKLKEAGNLAILPLKEVEGLTVSELVQALSGLYGVQYSTFINIPVSLILQIAAASIPAIATSAALKDTKMLNNKMDMVFRLGFMIGAPSAVAFFLYGKPIISLLLKSGNGGELLSVGAIGLLFIVLAQLSAAIIQAMGKPFVVCLNAMIACGVKVILNLIFMRMPSMHIYGVIHSTSLCYLIYSLLNLRYLYKTYEVKIDWMQTAIKPLVCAVIMGATSYIGYIGLNSVFGSGLSMLVIIPVAMVIYFVLVIMLGVIKREDLGEIPGGSKLKVFFK